MVRTIRVNGSMTTAAAAILGAGLLVMAMAGRAEAQAYPTKPIRLVITLSPGSAADTLGRVVGEGLSQQLGQPVIYENRAGGNGTIGANAVAKAEPDGYTLLVNTNLHTIAPALIANMPYNVETDFAGITPLGVSPHVLIISSGQNIKSIKELVAAAKSRPGGITYAAVAGSGTHLNGAHFLKTMQIDGRMVPFKGAPESITEVMTGRVDIYFSPILPALPHIQSGKLLGLAVSSKTRSSALPDVATTFDGGYPDSEFGLPFYLYAPAKTPRPIIDKLHAETVKVLNKPETKARFKQLGVDGMIMKPEELDAYTRQQVKVEGDQARAAGLTKQ
jgi:tripartite-type tricarboxylate transporter receptor subunit TctC